MNQQVLATLWQRIAERGNLPSLTNMVQRLARVNSAEVDVAEVANLVLEDFALTQKVLRMANSAMYAMFGNEITTVTQAITILGVDSVYHLAVSQKLIDSLERELAGQHGNCRQELTKAVLAGGMAAELAKACFVRNTEEAVVCTLLHNTGRLLTAFYLPEACAEITCRISPGGMPEQDAVIAVLDGLTYDDIAREAAQQWQLPRLIVDSLGPAASLNKVPGEHVDWLRAVSCAANDAAAAMAIDPDRNAALDSVASRYSTMLGLDPGDIVAALRQGLQGGTSSVLADKLSASAQEVKNKGIRYKPNDAVARMEAGVETLAAAMPSLSLHTLTGMIVETLYQSFGFNRVVAFTKEPKTNVLRARLGFGQGVAEKLKQLHFSEEFSPDVFHLAMTHQTSVFINDATADNIVHRLPVWHQAQLGDAKSFLVVPVSVGGRVPILLYGDWLASDGIHEITPEELNLVNVLRDMAAAAAVKQAILAARDKA